MNSEIEKWIDGEVLPRYDGFDKGHRRDHAEYVIRTALELAQHYDVDPDMIAVAAACHDLGLVGDRVTHHLESGRIIRSMSELRRWFTPEQIEVIAQAAEDHRASSKSEPRSIYGRIIAEADRQIVPETVIRRTVQYGLRNYPELNREGHWKRTLEHLNEKYAEGGYLRLWIPESSNAARLKELRSLIADTSALRKVFEGIYKEEIYRDLLPKVRSLCEGERDYVARMANVAALIHRSLEFWWTGFYRVVDDELVLGPFQGPVACSRIAYGKGVCGTAWKEGKTIVVPDVEQFPGHIACSSESRSEIVVPVFGQCEPCEEDEYCTPGSVECIGEICAVLDIDSRELGRFDDVDARWLEEIVKAITSYL